MLNPHSDAAADGQVPSQAPAGLSLSEAGPPSPPDAGLGTGGGLRAPRHVTQAPPTYSACLSAPSDRCGFCSRAERSHVNGGRKGPSCCAANMKLPLKRSMRRVTAALTVSSSWTSLSLCPPPRPYTALLFPSPLPLVDAGGTPAPSQGLPCGSPTSAQRTHRALAPSCASSQNHFLPGVTLVLLVTSCPTSKHPRAGAWSRRCPLKHWVQLLGRVQLNFVEWPLGKGRGRLGDLFTSS